METFYASAATGNYDQRSLHHERRMLALYRQKSSTEGRSLQPLANACWRAACFEWALYRDVETVRRLWGEGARALAYGFLSRRAGFDPSPDQLILALHLSIATREREAFTNIALSAPNLRHGPLRDAHAFRGSQAHFHLAEGYALVALALVEGERATARAATEALHAAREESDRSWWERQFPEALDATWRMREHDAICALLSAVAHRIADEASPDDEVEIRERALQQGGEFARLVDDAMLRLDKFIQRDVNHHPKLYVWLPGIALCALAASARLPMDWLKERCDMKATGYERLPFELLQNLSAS